VSSGKERNRDTENYCIREREIYKQRQESVRVERGRERERLTKKDHSRGWERESIGIEGETERA